MSRNMVPHIGWGQSDGSYIVWKDDKFRLFWELLSSLEEDFTQSFFLRNQFRTDLFHQGKNVENQQPYVKTKSYLLPR